MSPILRIGLLKSLLWVERILIRLLALARTYISALCLRRSCREASGTDNATWVTTLQTAVGLGNQARLEVIIEGPG